MRKVLTILALLAASNAYASTQPYKADNPASLHPVRMTEEQPEADFNLKRSCQVKPVLLLLRAPDGRIMLLGILKPKQMC